MYHDKIYVIAGYDGNSELKIVEVFDGNSWTLLESKMNEPSEIKLCRLTFMDDQIMVMGGTMYRLWCCYSRSGSLQ